ncbi:hypothetical protein MWU32_03405 [Gelidibacter sp. F63206]|nr:hypothetical protein [Gelidibacter sp. F63206]
MINGTDHKYGFGGKEEQDELGLGWMDFGARNYDKWLGRWMNIDPLADKYRDFTPYNYTANNPILYMDPDGRDIIISGNTKDAMFKLAQIAATRTGSTRINRLINSRSNYTMESVFWSSNSSYDPQKNNIKYPSSVWRYSIDGGAPGASYVAGHEITHAYNDDMGHRLTRKQNETSSVNFGNYMRSVYGEKKMRTSYFGLGLKFGKNEKLYNFKQEKVNDFKQTLDVSTGGNIFAGFSYETSSNGEESTTEYILSVTTKDGTYAYRKFTDKKEYDAASKRVNDLKKKEEKEDEKK